MSLKTDGSIQSSQTTLITSIIRHQINIILCIQSLPKDKVKLNDGETFGAELIANRLLNGVK